MVRDLNIDLSGSSKVKNSQGPVGTRVNVRARLVEWFIRWCPPVGRWIASNERVPSTDVNDLAQEVFLRLHQDSDEVIVENLQGYLLRVAGDVVQDWRERGRVFMPDDDVWLEALQIEVADEPENAIARARASQCLRTEIDRLPKRQREILLLHLTEGMTYQKIAEMRSLTHRIVLRDLTRAYATLRTRLFSPDGNLWNV